MRETDINQSDANFRASWLRCCGHLLWDDIPVQTQQDSMLSAVGTKIAQCSGAHRY